MERFITGLVKDYESGKLDRREFCKAVALAATVYAAGDAARAEPRRGFKMLGVNHISYTCPDYSKIRDWYLSVLGMDPVRTMASVQTLCSVRSPARAAHSWSRARLGPPRTRGRQHSRSSITSAIRYPIGTSPA